MNLFRGLRLFLKKIKFKPEKTCTQLVVDFRIQRENRSGKWCTRDRNHREWMDFLKNYKLFYWDYKTFDFVEIVDFFVCQFCRIAESGIWQPQPRMMCLWQRAEHYEWRFRCGTWPRIREYQCGLDVSRLRCRSAERTNYFLGISYL